MGRIKHPRKDRLRAYRASATLTDPEVREIRSRLALGHPVTQIAHDYIVHPDKLYKLRRGATYRWVK